MVSGLVAFLMVLVVGLVSLVSILVTVGVAVLLVRKLKSADVYCDFCGLLMDWDFQAALADKRSKQPGPTYEAIIQQLQPALTAAHPGSHFCGAVHRMERPLSGPPGSRPDNGRDVPGSAGSHRGSPLGPHTLDVAANSARHVLAIDGFRDRPPDRHHRAAGVLFRKIGLSAMVQGWLPYVPPSDSEKLLALAGLDGEYVELQPQTLRTGPCPHCDAPIEAADGAIRVLCHSCGHMVGAGCGVLECHGCGGSVEVPVGTNLFDCPHCEAELRMMRT